MLLSVTGFESSKTVQIRIYNLTTASEVVAWTATGVSERADGQGYSTYYYDYAVVAGDKYIVDWKDNSTPVNTASEGINEKQSGVALDSTVAKEATLTTILNRIGAFTGTGLNTVLGFLRSMSRKDAALTPSDMGGTYDNITDSLESSQAEHDATQVLINEKVAGSTFIQVVSATSGSVVVSAVKAGGTFQFVRGNEISYPYGPLGKDVTGRKIYFAVKKKASDTAYIIGFTDITANLTSITTFTGLIPFTAAMTKDLAAGKYYLAINSYASDDTTFVKPLTEATFVLDLVDRVINNP